MLNLTAPLRYGTHRLADVPWMFDGLRWMLEGGFRQHRQLLARHFSTPPARVLDCGCGTGIFAPCFSQPSYLGIDLSPAYIARARARYAGYRFQEMDASRMQLASQSFDAVIVSGVLHHMDRSLAQQVLSEIQRVLRPEGTLLMWEDVPTRGRINWLGHLVHQLDVGDHIRPAGEYLSLLAPCFQVESVEPMLSGCMDYVAIKARPHSQPLVHAPTSQYHPTASLVIA
ncbi:MAG: class I SAM-dependent methyltransferase [Pirellulaceae bacterium]|nr:class I SAM-dependent methyltransferase [Pirellulaceae bacterium]